MLTLISPAKTQDISRTLSSEISAPLFLDQTKELISYVRTLSVEELKKRMKVSDKLAQSSYEAFQSWNTTAGTHALALFSGDAFSTLHATSLSSDALEYAQDNLRILSGLYGSLRPFDEAKPYRLEMAYTFEKYPSLYRFWKSIMTQELLSTVQSNSPTAILNLASSEYFKALDLKAMPIPVITPQFKELREGELKTVSIFAKRARGACTRYILEKQMKDPDQLRAFAWEGYKFDPTISSTSEWFFVRKQ